MGGKGVFLSCLSCLRNITAKSISGENISPPVTRCRLNGERPRAAVELVESGFKRGSILDDDDKVDSFPKSILGRIKLFAYCFIWSLCNCAFRSRVSASQMSCSDFDLNGMMKNC